MFDGFFVCLYRRSEQRTRGRVDFFLSRTPLFDWGGVCRRFFELIALNDQGIRDGFFLDYGRTHIFTSWQQHQCRCQDGSADPLSGQAFGGNGMCFIAHSGVLQVELRFHRRIHSVVVYQKVLMGCWGYRDSWPRREARVDQA